MRLLAHFSQDKDLINAYLNKQDLYATAASKIFNKDYWECMEHWQDGRANPEGKKLRGITKNIVLGILYGRGPASVAEKTGQTLEQAKETINNFYSAYPTVKKWMDESIQMAKERGYVTTISGRRRRLPNIQLPPYTIKKVNIETKDTSPLFDTVTENSGNNDLVTYYKEKLDNCKNRFQMKSIIDEASKDGIEIEDNTGWIATATRQTVNCVDKDTEILTLAGWKKYNEISKEDKIYSLNTTTGLIEEDTIKDIFTYSGDFEAIRFKSNSFECISTLNHRWPTYSRGNKKITFLTTQQLSKYKNYGCRKIIKAANNNFNSNKEYSDSFLYILGILMTDGSIRQIPNRYELSDRYYCCLYQCKDIIKDKIRQKLKEANILYNEKTKGNYTTFYLKQPLGSELGKKFSNRLLPYDFINSLSQKQCQKLLEGIIDGDGYLNTRDTITIKDKEKANRFQYLIFRAGFASKLSEIDRIGQKGYSNKINNKEKYIETKSIYYQIRIHKRKHADIIDKYCFKEKINFVWCVSTNNETWVARNKQGYVFITGNSRIQGSAASLSKLAMMAIYNNQELKDLGFKTLYVIHDEIAGQCPKENADKVAELLKKTMIDSAAKICSVPMKVDCYIINHWYFDDLSDVIKERYDKLIKEGKSEIEAFDVIDKENPEIALNTLHKICDGTVDLINDDLAR